MAIESEQLHERIFVFCRAQIDEIQKKQDKLNAMKTRKANPAGAGNNSKELRGESPTRKPLATVKTSRSSSFNRVPLKRLTAVS
jgi:hypothetical protein